MGAVTSPMAQPPESPGPHFGSNSMAASTSRIASAGPSSKPRKPHFVALQKAAAIASPPVFRVLSHALSATARAARVAQTVAHMHEMARRNAALSEQSAASAATLSQQIHRLNQIVAGFRIQTAAGTPQAPARPTARAA